jgi:hypothetical protein
MNDRNSDRGLSPVIAVVALIAVSVTLVAVLGAYIVQKDPGTDSDIGARVTITFNDGLVIVDWVERGKAAEVKVVVGVETEVLDDPSESAEIPASRGQTVVVIAVDDEGNSDVIARESAGRL